MSSSFLWLYYSNPDFGKAGDDNDDDNIDDDFAMQEL